MTPQTTEILHVPPSAILVDDNHRFGLKPSRLETLKESILNHGGVHTPLTVSELEEPQGEAIYRLDAGHYRHQAVTELNTDQGAGLLLPVIVEPAREALDRLKRQLSENLDRENLTPMDKAKAIKQLFELGASKQEVRKMFAAPGGRKGMKVQDASNSHINQYLSFLEFPKAIQNGIHEGRITVGGAYELTKKPKEQHEAILAEIENDRLKALKAEDDEEEKYLAAEKKIAEAREKQTALVKEIETLTQTKEEAAVAAQLKLEEAQKAYTASLTAKDAEAKAKAVEAHKAAETDAKAAQKAAAQHEQKLKSLEEKREKMETAAKEKEAKLKTAKDKDKDKKEPAKVSAAAVKGAGKGGAPSPTYPVALNSLKGEFSGLAEKCQYPKVKVILSYVLQVLRGVTLPKHLVNSLAENVTGEKAKAEAKKK